MKIGILTQPLQNNYGGLLQAYALQTVLECMGHEVIILDRQMKEEKINWMAVVAFNFVVFLKNCIKLLLGKPLTVIYHELLPEQRKVVNRFTDIFIQKHHHKSPDFSSTEDLANYAKEIGIEAFVVGSDQCWRPLYSPCLPNYFLDFAKEWNVKKLSYAASFGVDTWEFSKSETEMCASLAKQFNAISVREFSGIELCRNYLGVNAVHVLDPTMLLDAEDYNKLFEGFDFSIFDVSLEHRLPDTLEVENNKLFCYVLDMNDEKKQFIAQVAKDKDLIPIYCMPKDFRAQEIYKKCPDDCTFPPVEMWLKSFHDATMVIADSFHGTVFSIIYNKPFWVLGNPGRGMARFHSLLKMFGLEDRLITPERFSTLDIDTPIDWNRVNKRRENLKQESLTFLNNNLSD